MTERNIKRASLEEIRKMQEEGELFHDPQSPSGDDLGEAFWAKAVVVEPRKPRSVHLKLDADVFEFFYEESRGKGHLTRMQNVLRAYAEARRKRA